MPLSPEDHELSMRLSPRSPNPSRNEGLRSLLVHRLDRGQKAVWRLSLSQDRASLFCEPCKTWIRDVDLAEEIVCPQCERHFMVEAAILTEVPEGR